MNIKASVPWEEVKEQLYKEDPELKSFVDNYWEELYKDSPEILKKIKENQKFLESMTEEERKEFLDRVFDI
jgi:hypothetical protein